MLYERPDMPYGVTVSFALGRLWTALNSRSISVTLFFYSPINVQNVQQMKQTILLLAASALLIASCSKNSGSNPSTGSYTCTCSYKKNPVTDTVVYFKWSGITAEQATSKCAYEDTVYKSFAGKNGASCTL